MTQYDEILTLFRNLRLLRQQYGLTEQEMAAILHIGVHTLDRLEHDDLPPRMRCDFLFYASEHFHIEIRDLLRPLDIETEQPPD